MSGALAQFLREAADKAKEASAEASYDAEKWKQHGRMQAFLEAADLADNPPVARPNVVAVGQPLMCIVCLRGAHWKIDGTSYCRDHAMSVFQELREKAKK